jgi:hypothetical protein
MADAPAAPARDGGPTPRCPACGERLYGWIVARAADPRRRERYVVDRCESCGLGVTRGPEGERAELLEHAGSRLRPGEALELTAPNRGSLQAGIGGEHWAALELPAQRLHLTPRSLELLLASQGLALARLRQPLLGRNQLWMWQTLLNAFTFHDNVAVEVLRGRLTPRTARSRTALAIDVVVSLLAGLPVAIASVPLEVAAALTRRGGLLAVTARPKPDQDSSSTSSASSPAASS